MLFCHLLFFGVFFQINFLKKIEGIPSECLEQDQARHNVWPDLDSNCLSKLSADNKSCHLQVKSYRSYTKIRLFIAMSVQLTSAAQSCRLVWLIF